MRLSLTPGEPRQLAGTTRRGSAARVSAPLVLAAMALVTSACSVKQDTNANLILGKQQFVAKCGACHTLARAETKGTVGPNLDEAFRYGIAEAHGRSTIHGAVEHQVLFPNPEGVMPKEIVHGAVLNDVAAYVAQAADRPGRDSGLLASAVAAPGSGKPAVEKAGKLEIDANPQGQLAYVTNKASATPGPVTISMANMSGVSHNIAIQQGSSGATQGSTPVLGASSFITKGSTSVSVTLKPGTYTYFCQAPGHRAAGMWGTLIVK